jgi:DNA mismatch endonuclease, patch repair protein
MVDRISVSKRSWNMRRIRSKNTSPEIRLRKVLFSLGFRYRINCKGMSGKPDLVFPKYQSVVFVHGCFWHQHGCRRSNIPKSNVEYWTHKFRRNIERDACNQLKLEASGWRYLAIWECEINGNINNCVERVRRFLLGPQCGPRS